MRINRPAKRRVSTPDEVEPFLAALEHPFKQEMLALRQVILSADPSIREGIKWNAPSFRTTEYFATVHLRAKDGVQLILHLGAKKRASGTPKGQVADPESLLSWLGDDRASVMFCTMQELEDRCAALAEIVRKWIRYVQ